MSIDRMKKVTVVCEKNGVSRLFKRLYDLGVMEVADVTALHGDADGQLRRTEVSTAECDAPLQKIGLALGLMDAFAPEQQSFIKGLAPVPLLVDTAELDAAVSGFDLEKVFNTARELDERHRQNEHTRGDIQSQLEELALFQGIQAPMKSVRALARVRAVFGQMPAARVSELENSPEARALLVWERMPGAPAAKNAPERLVVAYAAEKAEEARALLGPLGFEETPPPPIDGRVDERITDLRADLARTAETAEKIRADVTALASNRRALQVLKAFWDGRKRRKLAETQSVQGGWVAMLAGYVREADVPAMQKMLAAEFTGASVELADPAPEDDVPVNLTESKFAAPLKLLTGMFGLPAYTAFDPSPFMLVNFYVFFGICFSDAAYGIMLMLLSGYIIRRTRDYEGVNNFARLLFFAGVSTTIFGFAMGSFFGDLYKASFVPANNPLALLMAKVTILDPQVKVMPALGIALALGILNQFYGIGLKMYGALKAGDKTAAVCDGLLWLIALPGFVILAATMFVPGIPAGLGTLGMALFGAGALGLVLTQGRDAEGIVAKIGVGVMSIYGIVGTYGLTAFLGDVMSYCRLLALGLTTGILAVSFNMIAGMLWDVPGVGPVLTVLVLVLAHVFNFMINVLGAFVHAMRLLFVEWFGRFYEGGGRAFEPLGFNTPAAVLKRQEAPRG